MVAAMRNLTLFVAALAATPAAAADLSVSNAWVRLPAVPGRPAAAYFMINGGNKPQTVIGVSSPSAKKAEMHESTMVGGLMRMGPLPKLVVGKSQAVMFAPGGKHVMLFGLDPRIKPGGTVKLNLKLGDGGTASVDAKATGAANSPPSGMNMPMGHGPNH